MPTPPPPLDPRRWLVAVVMMTAALMDLLDGTVLNVALPTIQRDLHAGGDQLAWVVSAYLLAFAASLITAGQLGDRYGRRRLFLLGTAAFGAASLASALAQTPGQLVAFRVVQGVAAAVVAPQVLATYRVIFPREERGKAFAMYGAVGGLAASLGLIAGGALTSADLFGTGLADGVPGQRADRAWPCSRWPGPWSRRRGCHTRAGPTWSGPR